MRLAGKFSYFNTVIDLNKDLRRLHFNYLILNNFKLFC